MRSRPRCCALFPKPYALSPTLLAWLLNVVYFFVLLAASPWLIVQSVRTGKYREGYGAKFWGLAPKRTSDRRCVWLHAVSVGEVNLLAPLLKRIERERPDWECVVSTTTKTGMELARKKYAGHTVFYCPLDFSWATARAVRRIRPDLLVLAELELWPNLIRSAKNSGAKVAVINGRLSEKSFRGYRKIRFALAGLMRSIDRIAVQDETYAERFLALGAKKESVVVTGSMKFDGAQTDRDNPATRRLAALAGYSADDVVFLVGSTQDPEEAAALAAFQSLKGKNPHLRLIVVPRHPERFNEVAELIARSSLDWRRRSELKDEAPLQTSPQVLLVDAVGELGAWWGLAKIAFVGGSFGARGGQNMIEPAAYGAAVSFGPNTWNFRDIVASMLAHNAAKVVADAAELERFVGDCLENPAQAETLGRRARELVLAQQGATEKTFRLLDALVTDREKALAKGISGS